MINSHKNRNPITPPDKNTLNNDEYLLFDPMFGEVVDNSKSGAWKTL